MKYIDFSKVKFKPVQLQFMKLPIKSFLVKIRYLRLCIKVGLIYHKKSNFEA